MKKFLLSFLLLILTHTFVWSQDFMMQAWYWDYFKQNNAGARWATHLNSKATDLKQSGFSHIWIPPANRTSTPNDTSNGYNPRDFFDYGDPINGLPRPTMLGTRSELNTLIASFNAQGIKTIADMVYNHRDGGKLEVNTAVKAYTDGLNGNKDPFPCDRMVLALPLGAQNPGANGAGDYYFKFSSKTGNYGASNRYNLYMRTSQTTTFLGTVDETEPNGGGDCGQPFNVLQLGQDMRAYLGSNNNCNTDEFKVTLTNSNLRDNGTTKDTLWIYMRPLEGGYADQRPYGIWSAARNTNIINELLYMTFTDFSSLPSGQGAMNAQNFRPNTANQATETLRGDYNSMLFFYDIDQDVASTKTVLNDWTKWNWNNVGMRGFRMDAVKHFSPSYVSQMLNDLHSNNINPSMVVGEYYDGNPSALKSWVDAVYAGMSTSAKDSIKPRVFDFALRGALRDASDTPGFDVRNVFSSGVVDGAGGTGYQAVTFVNNHDFRSVSGWDAPVQNNPMLAYAYIMTNNRIGLPCVFYPDYYGITYPNAPTVNLKTQIDALMNLHKKYIFGATQVEYLNKEGSFYQTNTGGYISGSKTECLIYQIKGGAAGKDVIVAINYSNNSLKVDHTINTANIAAGTRFYDHLGNAAFPYGVVNNSKVYLELPAKSYSVWVQDIDPNAVAIKAKVFLNHVDNAGIMDNYAVTQGYVPLSDPYNSFPLDTIFTHVTNTTTVSTSAAVMAASGPNAIVDWVFVELRNGPSGATSVVSTRAGLLQADGDIVDVDGVSPLFFPNTPPGNYYITIRHQSNVGFRTVATYPLNSSPAVTFNFTNNSIALNGGTTVKTAAANLSFYCMISGDSNADGSIDGTDATIWETQNGMFLFPYPFNSDFNFDGSIDGTDATVWEANNGAFQELD